MAYNSTPLEFAPGANQGDLLTTVRAYEARGMQGWGLCWYFAAEVAERFYAFSGIEPRTILHEEGGFLGIKLVVQGCSGNGGKELVLGKFTLDGLVENWTAEKCLQSCTKEELLEIPAEMRLFYLIESLPLNCYGVGGSEVHEGCRHRHRALPYCLMFRLAALFSMRHDVDSGWSVINDGEALRSLAQEHDPEYDERACRTYFLFRGNHDLLVCYDGRIILPGPVGDYWGYYDRIELGEQVDSLIHLIEYSVTYGKADYDGTGASVPESRPPRPPQPDEAPCEPPQEPAIDPALAAFVEQHHVEGLGCWNRQLVEAASWRLACELYRRFPKWFALIEYHPGGGQSDCLGLLSEQGTININRNGTLHLWGSGGSDLALPLDIWPAMMKTESYRKLLDDVCALAGLRPPQSMPASTPKSLVYRFIAAFLSQAVFGIAEWDCRSGYLDTSGYGGGTVKGYFEKFPAAAVLLRADPGDRDLDNSGEFWFLLKDREPKLALHVSGWAAREGAQAGMELMPLYQKHGRRVWPVVLEVAGKLLP